MPSLPRLAAAAVAIVALLTFSNASAIDFLPPQIIDLGNSTDFSHAVKTGDLNHDGLRDIVVADWVSNVMDIILAQPGGTYAPVVRIPSANAPYTVELRDMNGDTHLDLITGNRSGRSVSVYLGDGTGGFTRTDYDAPAEVSAAAVGDVTGDGKLDVVAAADLRVCVFAGDGAGHLAAPVSTVLGSSLPAAQVWGLAVGDLDSDGDLDVVTNYNGPLVELVNQGNGTFTRRDFAVSLGARALAVVDFTGDGKADVVATSDAENGVVVFTGDGLGGLSPGPVTPTGVSPWSLGIADLDGDGRLDVVTPNIGSNTLSVLLGTPGGGLASPQTLSTALNPISVDVADMSSDGHPDIVETGYSGTVGIRLQLPSGGSTPSSVSLSASPSPVTYGADVTLTATVTPSTASGGVRFLDGGGLLGISPVEPGGVAHFTTHSFSGGIHSNLNANYLGDASLLPSVSPFVALEVTQAPTTTAITSTPNPSSEFTDVVVVATVQATPPSAIGGFVIFRLDGVLWRKVDVDGSTNTAGTVIPGLSLGHHTIVASYEGTSNHQSSLSPTIDQAVVGPEPVIASARDVPNDQGGKVTIKWDSPADASPGSFITRYRIWRRAPAGIAALFESDGVAPRCELLQPPGAASADYWEALAELPAEGLGHYAYTAATTQDSLPGSNPYTAFFVSALTSNPGIFFHSAVDSGYSVDNLAPPAPAPMSVTYGGSGNDLHWTAQRTPDLREYRVYRGALIDFELGPTTLIAVTSDTTLHDTRTGSFIYKLVAVDRHGNTSRVLVASPGTPVATLASIAKIEALPDRVRLLWYSPGGPGTPAKLYRREPTTDWELLADLSFDGRGYLEYDDARIATGYHYGYRLGIQDGDHESFTQEAWIEDAPVSVGLEMALGSSNPSPTGRLVVALSLPSSSPARLELVDITGRRVLSQDLSSLGVGRHTVTLEGDDGLRAGIYVLRLLQGSASVMRRVTVIP